MKRPPHRKQPGYRGFVERGPRTPGGDRWRREKALERLRWELEAHRLRLEAMLPVLRIEVPDGPPTAMAVMMQMDAERAARRVRESTFYRRLLDVIVGRC